MKNRTLGFLALFVAAIIFSIFSIFIRILNVHLDTNQQVALRGLTGFLTAIFFIIILRKNLLELKKLDGRFLVFYAFSFPVAVVGFTAAVTQTSIAITVAAFYAATLLGSLLLGLKFFEEKFTLRKMIALIFSLVGIAVIFLPLNLSNLNIGIFFALISGTFDAIANAFRKYFGGKVDKLVLSSVQMLAIFGLGAFLALANGTAIVPNLPVEIWGLGFIYGASILGISLLLLYGFSQFDLNLGTIVLSSEIFIAPLIALFVINEIPAAKDVVAGLLVFFAVVITEVKISKKDVLDKKVLS